MAAHVTGHADSRTDVEKEGAVLSPIRASTFESDIEQHDKQGFSVTEIETGPHPGRETVADLHAPNGVQLDPTGRERSHTDRIPRIGFVTMRQGRLCAGDTDRHRRDEHPSIRLPSHAFYFRRGSLFL